MPRVVTFGEIMLRLTPPGHQRIAQAASFEITFGGAEANVAVAIAQLGGRADYVTKLPKNEIAERALDELRRCGVGLQHVARGGERIGVYYLEQGASQRAGKVIYDRAHSAIATATPDDFPWERILEGARWFHWSGITPALSPAAASLTREACIAARRAGATVSFDMNYRSRLWTVAEAAAALLPLMQYVDVCVCGATEARDVFGIDGDSDAAIAAAMTQRFGFKTVGMSRRHSASASYTSWEATLFSDGESFASPRHEISVVDRVGAGDGFTGALIFALTRGDPPASAINFAAAAGALKHTIAGDFALLSLAEVEALAAGGDGGRVQR